jgi:hypothetical protein
MAMIRRIPVVTMALILVSTGVVLAGGDRWLHVRVQEAGDTPQTVRVNVPLSLIERVVPLIDVDEFHGGKIRLGEQELGSTDLRAIWQEIKDTEDAEFVTVEGGDDNVRVSKKGDYLVAEVQEGRGSRESVTARLPLAVIDALLSGDKDELNILAAIKALAAHEGDLVAVKDDKSTVRVWIDGSNRSE